MIGYGRRVLVIDGDESEWQETTLIMLEQAGFNVVQACDGQEPRAKCINNTSMPW